MEFHSCFDKLVHRFYKCFGLILRDFFVRHLVSFKLVQSPQMAFKLFIVLEALEYIVSWQEVLHSTIDCRLKARPSHHLGLAFVANHLVDLLEPKRHKLGVFVAN